VGPAVVDAGGDIAVTGARLSGEPWPIGVADPCHPGEQITLLKILSGGVATSGRDYRRWRQEGAWLHHIIDPRTRRPAQTDVLAVTVIAPSTAEAESAAKTVLILGSQEGRAWLERRPRLAGLLVLEDGRALRSTRFPTYEWR
jgi:thiamine biosynthesis lipoprotein